MKSEFGGVADTGVEGRRDAQLEALAHSQRRALLEYLLEEDPTSVTPSAAVAHLTSTTNQNYQQVETVLVHRHLPRLEDAEIIAYDSDEELLSYTGDEFVTGVLDLL